MISNKLFTVFLLLLATAVLSLSLFTKGFFKAPMLVFKKGDNYEKLWKEVQAFEQKGLTQSALDLIETIYKKAKTEKNASQFVKAVIHRMKFESYKEEFSLETSILKLRAEVETAEYPIKPVLQSILADAYWEYFQNNRWKFYDRTQTVNFDNNDLQTWDLTTILNATIKSYKASLSNVDSLKRTRLDLYDDILVKGTTDTRLWRPTLYDFLAHRSLDFFKNTEADVNRPEANFHVNDEAYLKPYSEFLSAKINLPSDSLELKYYALELMQQLTTFHKNDKNTDALIDIELERLSYCFGNSQHELKDSIYLNTLKTLSSKFNSSARVTEIDYAIANWYLSEASKYNPLDSDNYKWYRKKAIEIATAAQKKFPESYGAKECKNLIQTIQRKTFTVTVEEVNEPNKPFRALVNYSNVSKLYFKLVKTTHNELKDLNAQYYNEELYRKLAALPVVKTFEQTLPNDNDFNSHNVEVKMPELPYGYYVILASHSPDFKTTNNLFSYANCVVSNISTIERRNNKDGTYEFYVLHRQTGDPLSNVQVQLWHENYNYDKRKYERKKGEVHTTDSKGHFKVAQNTDNNNQFYVEVKNGDDVYYNTNGYYVYKPNNEKHTYVKSFIFADRSIYRPGQTVYFKGIVLETNGTDNKLKINYPVTMVFYDVNGQKISSLDLVTNEFGTVSGSFVTPQGVLNGQMRISDGMASNVYFSVEEYKRPKFEVAFDALKGSYAFNDDITVTGKAKAYAGNYIDAASVKYRVVREVRFPYWWYWYRPYYTQGGNVEIKNGTVTTNDTGTYSITFKALPDPTVSKEAKPIYSYAIYADVTDSNGETHSDVTHVNVGYKSLELNIDINDDIIELNSIDGISVTATNLNGIPEVANTQVTVYKLKQPKKVYRKRLWAQPDNYVLSKDQYEKAFPHDLYADETNKYKWEKDGKVLSKTIETGSKKEYNFQELKTAKPGVYLIEATCKDKTGQEVKAINYFTLYSKTSAELPEATADWFYCPNTKAEPNESISYTQASSYTNVNYLYQLERQNEVVESNFKVASTNPHTISIQESDRGNVVFHTTFVKHNRFYNNSTVITVPYTNKELDIQFETFRDKLLPGQQEEWKLIIKNKKGEKMAAEMLAGMYDASLDAFKKHLWPFYIYNTYYSSVYWSHSLEKTQYSNMLDYLSKEYIALPNRSYDMLNYFGLNFNSSRHGGYDTDDGIYPSRAMSVEAAEASPNKMATGRFKDEMKVPQKQSPETTTVREESSNSTPPPPPPPPPISESENGGGNVKARSNFNETAFFFPHLQTDNKGNIVIKFTMPESLTKWKFMGLAHTKDLKYGQITKTCITQKELMVQPNAPRFLRENDQLTFTSKVVNLSENKLDGTSQLYLYDALTNKDITSAILKDNASKSFSINKGLSTPISWELTIPEGFQAVKYKVIAKAGNYTDGEEMVLPVLTNRMLVTESMPLPIKSNQTKEYTFTKFISQNNKSTTLKNHSYTLEFTANPAWYALQALPYLMEYPYECAEQTFSRYYANSLASHIANSKPKIKQVFDAWSMNTPDAFLSNLQKNQELKALMLEETPWVMEAKNESERKKRVALLFDLNKMSNELSSAMKKLMNMQASNGGWPWFEGMPDDWYITQHIVTGMGHLDKLGVTNIRKDNRTWDMVYKAIKYCDERVHEEYTRLKKSPNYEKDNHLSYMTIQYLYARSYFKDVDIAHKEAFEFYKKQAQKYWLSNNRYLQGMIALSLNRYSDTKTAKDILKSLKENALVNEEMGMYWKENYNNGYWYEAPIESQALLIEAFDEITNDTKVVDDLKTWLIKSKQTQNWQTTKATTEAVYALLLRGTDWLATEPNVEISLGAIKIDPKKDPTIKTEAGTGYFKKTWTGSEITPAMGNVKVSKKDKGVSWGSVYWQYFEQLDKITPHETPLKLSKKLFLEKLTSSGVVIEPITTNTALKPGDKLKVRIELRVDRDMQYIHMKDMRASGLEPTNVFSGYKWQDGLGYYQSTKDASTNFFISYLNKGTYVFEYPLVVSHYGDFSNGITSIQCMYAPEFTSHSEGIRLKVKK